MNPLEMLRGFSNDFSHLPLMVKLMIPFMAGSAGWSWWKEQRKSEMVAASVAWPIYRARVVSAQVVADRESSSEDRGSWVGVLTYSYTVPGRELEVGEYRKNFFDEGDAQVWAAGFSFGFVDVRVDPADATRSVWDEASYVAAPLAMFGQAAEVEELGWRSVAMLLVFCASAVGAVLAACIQVSCLLGKPMIDADRNSAAFFGMHVGAIVLGIAGAMMSRRRGSWSSRMRGAFASEQSVALPIKVLGFYTTVVFLYGFVRMAAHSEPNGDWSELIFSAVWLPFYVGAAIASWHGMRESAG